jgi:hypothetical protein
MRRSQSNPAQLTTAFDELEANAVNVQSLHRVVRSFDGSDKRATDSRNLVGSRVQVRLWFLRELLDYFWVDLAKSDFCSGNPLVSDKGTGIEDYDVGCVEAVSVVSQPGHHLDAVLLIFLI